MVNKYQDGLPTVHWHTHLWLDLRYIMLIPSTHDVFIKQCLGILWHKCNEIDRFINKWNKILT